MDPLPPPDDPLRTFLSGRRRWRRVRGKHAVQLRGRRTGFVGRILDLSRGGLRVAVEDPAFYEEGGDGLTLVTRRFPRGATVRFVAEGIARRVRIVRIMPHEGLRLALGCEFEKALTGGEAARLGVGTEAFGRRGAGREIEIAADA